MQAPSPLRGSSTCAAYRSRAFESNKAGEQRCAPGAPLRWDMHYFCACAPPPPSRPSPPLRTASSSRCHNAAGLAAVILCRHRFCHVPPQVFRSRVAHARVFDSDGRRRRARFISKKCGGRSFRSVHSVPGSHAHDLNSRSLAEMVHRLMVTAGVWSPAGGWWADPVHWRRNTALAFLCVPPCSAPLRHGCQ